MNPQEAFLEMLVAAMHDAVLEDKISQLQTQFIPKGKKEFEVVRIVILPEKMKYKWPTYAPLGTLTKPN